MENQKKNGISTKMSGRGIETTEVTEGNDDPIDIGNGLVKN